MREKLLNLKIKYLLVGAVVICLIALGEFQKLPGGKLRIVACDVGQGDAIYIQTPQGKDILIDGGPDDKVLGCLSNHMGYFNRTIEVVFLTHPEADHLAGLVPVLQRYQVGRIFLGPEGNNSDLYRQFKQILLSQKNTIIANAVRGDMIKTADGVEFELVWPTKQYIADNITAIKTDSTNTQIADSGVVLGANTAKNLNRFSLILRLKYGQFSALFMGDGDDSIDFDLLAANPDLGEVDLLKVPHHGSKTGMTNELLQKLRPKTAIISVGKDNRFGHPAPEILRKLSEYGTNILRTDKSGEIVIER